MLFKSIWIQERVESWNQSTVNLIHKGQGKTKKSLKNYRPLSLMNTICKIFAGILDERMRAICKTNK